MQKLVIIQILLVATLFELTHQAVLCADFNKCCSKTQNHFCQCSKNADSQCKKNLQQLYKCIGSTQKYFTENGCQKVGTIPDEYIDKILDCTDSVQIQDEKQRQFFGDAVNSILQCSMDQID